MKIFIMFAEFLVFINITVEDFSRIYFFALLFLLQ